MNLIHRVLVVLGIAFASAAAAQAPVVQPLRNGPAGRKSRSGAAVGRSSEESAIAQA